MNKDLNRYAFIMDLKARTGVQLFENMVESIHE